VSIPLVKSSLERLGIGRPELRAWALYDWANSAFSTTMVAAVFPIYFADEIAGHLGRSAATTRFSATTTIALVIAAIVAPWFGTVVDRREEKIPLLRVTTLVGVVATGGLAFVGQGDLLVGAGLFIVAEIAMSASIVCYDALLPLIAARDEADRVSTAGYALGYIGGGLLLALNLAWLRAPSLFGLADAGAAARLSFFSVALWWAGFALPLLRRRGLGVSTPMRPTGVTESGGHRSMRATLRTLGRYPQALLMLTAFLIYGDGISTIIRMAAIYGAEIGIDRGALVAALLVTQFVGVPFSFLFGALGVRIGAKRAICLGLGVYTAIAALAPFMRTPAHFFALALLVGTVQGGTQALSRSLFSTLLPRSRSGEFFGFFAISEKFAGIIGPAVFGIVTAVTGTSRAAVAVVGAFFVIGGILLARVDVQAGQAAAIRELTG
jgi:UMF1 family MFS transporter